MQKGILPELLKTLDAREKKRFLLFVESPFFNQKPEVRRLAERLLRPEATDESSEKQPIQPIPQFNQFNQKRAAFPAVFGDEADYDDARLRKTMEHLLRALERFLVLENVENEALEQRLRLARLLAQRKQEKLLRRLFESPLPLPKAECDWTMRDFDLAARWFRLRYDHRSALSREHDPALYREILRCETTALLARRLYDACIFRSNQKRKNDPAPEPPLPGWQQFLADETYARLPLLQTLAAAFRTLDEPENPAHFEVFKAGLLDREAVFFASEERRELLLVAINHCSQRYNAGDKSLIDSHLELFDYGLREGLLLENGWLTGYTFTNVATLALIGRRLGWLDQFLKDFSEKIALRDRSDTAAFNRARLHHARREYQPALELLQKTTFDDLPLNLAAKTVQAKCFYELGELDLLDAHLEAMRKFIRRHGKSVGYYAELYLNFIFALRRLANARPEELPALREEFSKMPSVAEKEWLANE